LLWDVVRVVTRLVGHLAEALGRRRVSRVSEIGRDRRGVGCKRFNG
jgi:hypothetical protein